MNMLRTCMPYGLSHTMTKIFLLQAQGVYTECELGPISLYTIYDRPGNDSIFAKYENAEGNIGLWCEGDGEKPNVNTNLFLKKDDPITDTHKKIDE